MRFRIESGPLVFEGVGNLENGLFTGRAQAENRSMSISGVIFEEEQTPEYANLRLAGHDGGDFVFMRKQ
jgi:hypothetical protein